MDKLTLTNLTEIVRKIVPEDTSIAIADNRQFIHYQPSKLVNLNIQPGDEILEETVTFKALNDQRTVSEFKDSRLYGIPYYGISIPLLGERGPKGCVTAILPHKKNYFPTELLTIRTTDRWIPVHFSEVISLEAVQRKTLVTT